MAVEKQVLPPDLQPAVPAGEAGQDAEPFVAVGVVDLDLNIRRPLLAQHHPGVGGPPVGHALIDEGENHGEVDQLRPEEVHVFAVGAGAGAVVLVQLDVGGLIGGTEAVAQGLDDPLPPVLQPVHTGQIQVDAPAEQAPPLVPVQVHVDAPTVFRQVDLVALSALLQADFGEIHLRLRRSRCPGSAGQA